MIFPLWYHRIEETIGFQRLGVGWTPLQGVEDPQSQKKETRMQILEHENEWAQNYQKAVIKPFLDTGVYRFDGYAFAHNRCAPQGTGVDLASVRLLFISSSGAFIPGEQAPFAAEDPLGDYSLRRIPAETPLAELDYAHAHYDQAAVREDPQTLLPVRLLRQKKAQGTVGALTDHWVSFMGYQPDLTRVVHETIPPILDLAAAENAQAALLVPA